VSSVKQGKAYRWRQKYERYAGKVLTMSLVLLIFGTIPYIYDTLQQWTAGAASIASDFEISGELANDGAIQITGSLKTPAPAAVEAQSRGLAGLIGAVSTLFGVLSGLMAFVTCGRQKKGLVPMGLVVTVGTAALWFGLLVIAYHLSSYLWASYSDAEVYGVLFIAAVAIAIVGLIANINYISIHRFYRDRLMEAFMPDVDKALNGKIATRAVAAADKMALFSLLDEQAAPGRAENPSPYHLINTNVVLDSSQIPKFRGRGGDNFILLPGYCGSKATGWSRSDMFMNGRMNLPTATAISGAAVSPSTGIGGEGVTRQPLLSMLMGLLNIRLGYWAPNPAKRTRLPGVPNHFFLA